MVGPGLTTEQAFVFKLFKILVQINCRDKSCIAFFDGFIFLQLLVFLCNDTNNLFDHLIKLVKLKIIVCWFRCDNIECHSRHLVSAVVKRLTLPKQKPAKRLTVVDFKTKFKN